MMKRDVLNVALGLVWGLGIGFCVTLAWNDRLILEWAEQVQKRDALILRYEQIVDELLKLEGSRL
jgi:hypothetical protein